MNNAHLIFYVEILTRWKEIKIHNTTYLDIIKNKRLIFSSSRMKRISNTNEFLALKLGTDVKGSPTNQKIKGVRQIHFRAQFKFKCHLTFWTQ